MRVGVQFIGGDLFPSINLPKSQSASKLESFDPHNYNYKQNLPTEILICQWSAPSWFFTSRELTCPPNLSNEDIYLKRIVSETIVDSIWGNWVIKLILHGCLLYRVESS